MDDKKNTNAKSLNSQIAENLNKEKYSEMKEVSGVGKPLKKDHRDSYTLSPELTYDSKTNLPKIPASLNWTVNKKKINSRGVVVPCYHIQLKSNTFTLSLPNRFIFTFQKNLMDRAVLQDPGLIVFELTDKDVLDATEEIYQRILELQVNYRNESRLLGLNPAIRKLH